MKLVDVIKKPQISSTDNSYFTMQFMKMSISNYLMYKVDCPIKIPHLSMVDTSSGKL